MNQCMGCQARWPVHHRAHTVVGGYPHERVACTADRYDDEIAALKLALAEMTAARDEAVAIAESAATWLEANTDKSARRGVAKLVHAKLPRLRNVGKKAT